MAMNPFFYKIIIHNHDNSVFQPQTNKFWLHNCITGQLKTYGLLARFKKGKKLFVPLFLGFKNIREDNNMYTKYWKT